MSEKDTDAPMEMSLEDGNSAEQLKEILAEKARRDLATQNLKGLHVLKKSRFYYNGDKLREHIGTYMGKAILIKQEHIKEELNSKENKMFPSLVDLKDLKLMRKVNGNVVRKLQPKSVHEYEKMALIQAVVTEMDKGV